MNEFTFDESVALMSRCFKAQVKLKNNNETQAFLDIEKKMPFKYWKDKLLMCDSHIEESIKDRRTECQK